jgi:hypothetical protein
VMLTGLLLLKHSKYPSPPCSVTCWRCDAEPVRVRGVMTAAVATKAAQPLEPNDIEQLSEP